MRAIRFGICVLVAFGVLAHGAVEPWSESVLEMGAAALLLWWIVNCSRQQRIEIVGSALFLPLLALGGIGLAQWFLGISAYPYQTKVELLRLAACFVLFFLSVQSFRSTQHLRSLLWFLLALGFVVAVFAILQYFTFNQKIYWAREVRDSGTVFGPYVNRNHFAGLMELILPLGMAMLLLRPVPQDQLPMVGLFTVVPIGALFLAASRGGITSFAVQIVFLGLLMWARARGRKRLAAATLLLLLAGAFLAWLDVGRAVERFTRMEFEEVSRGRRLAMMHDSWRIFLDHPWTGTGLGTLAAVYPQYESYYDGKVVDHAHNDYVELLAEAGWPGAACALVFVILLFRLAVTKLAADKIPLVACARVGALVACAGLLVHGLVDFNLQIPANLLLFLLMAGVATSAFPQPAANPPTRAASSSHLTV